MRCKHNNRLKTIACLVIAILVMSMAEASAASTTITLKNGDLEEYGSYATRVRWVTHVNGEAVDLDDEPGVTRSYAYCVQPALDTPEPGTYNVTVVDDDDTGKLAKMRKMIYYLPGAYGYTKVTKKRWFSSLPGGTSAYTIGHVALSYLYDNCSTSSDAWTGTNAAIKDKVKDMVADLGKLADAPDDFEVFWIKTSGKQDTFGAIYATEYGKAAVKKSSQIETITEGNACYTLEGAKYTVYENSTCTTVAKTKSGANAVITIKADGTSNAVEIETGDYYVKETTAPRGYALDTKVYSISVTKDKTTTLETKEVPKSNPVGVFVQKVDTETHLSKPQGAASLEGAEFVIKYYDVYPSKGMNESNLLDAISEKKPAVIAGKEAKWEFKIGPDCIIDLSNAEETLIKDKSAELYRNSKGEVVFPIGIVTVQEIKAPKGYLLNSKVYARAITEEGDIETINTLEALTGENSIDDQVCRADIEFSKSSEGIDRMQNVPFRITSLTTKESHVIVTDENGYANTAAVWNRHDCNTNVGLSNEDGLWFNGMGDEELGAKPSNTLCALPYDTYLLEELPCESNQGHELFSDTITIKRNGVVIDLGTFDNKLVPEEVKVHKAKPVKDTPKTGDEQMLTLYASVGVLSLLELALLTAIKKGGRLGNR